MTAKQDSVLAQGIGFDANDLSDNLAGRLSRRQSQKLLQSASNFQAGIVALMIFLSVIFLPLAHLSVGATGSTEPRNVLIVIWLALMAVFLVEINKGRRTNEDVIAGKVAIIYGTVQCFPTSTSRGTNTYNIRVDDLTFTDVAKNTYLAFTLTLIPSTTRLSPKRLSRQNTMSKVIPER